MKKITLSVAALALALSSNAQQAYLDTTIKQGTTYEALTAKENHENLYEIVIRAEDMITMLKEDVKNEYIDAYYTEFYEDLLEDIIELSVDLPNVDKSDFEDSKARDEVYKITEVVRK